MPSLNFLYFATTSALLNLGSPLFSSYFNQKRQLTTSLSLCQVSSSGTTASFVHSNLSLETSTVTDDTSALSSLAAIEMMCKGLQLSDSLSYQIDRISYNKELQNLLWKGQLLQVTARLQKLREQDVKLNVDTVHILISDSFTRKDVSSVEHIYRQYFESNLLTPTSRTLNIIMEGYRMLRDETKVFHYRDRFGHFNISMDSYSYSTLIRTARTAKSIKAILSVAASGKSLSQPLMRCAIESLGKLGDPFGAVNVASRLSELDSDSDVYNRVSSLNDTSRSVIYRSRSIFDSIASADSLLVALLENPQSLLVPSSDDDQQFGERARLINRSRVEITENTSCKWADPTHFSEADSVFQMYSSDQCSLAQRVEGMRCGDAAIHLILASHVNKDRARSTSPDVYVSENVVSAAATSSHATTIFSKNTQRDVLVCGSKGWCRIFTFLQRSIRENLEELELTKDYNNNSKMRSRHEAFKLQSKKLRDIRDQLWLRLLSEILEVEASELEDAATANETVTVGVVDGDSTRTPPGPEGAEGQESSGGRKSLTAPLVSAGGTVTAPTSAPRQISFAPVSFSANSASNSRRRGMVELNGRLSDALLRCYLEDAEKAKKMWKNSILPIAKRLSASSKNAQSFEEVCEKSLEALMFVSGYNNRADLGFEIALTVRNRNWDPAARSKLAKSYVQGKVQTKRRETQWLKSNILNDGLERSIESELGVQLVDYYSPDGSSPPPKNRSRQWPQRIRIQFKTEGLSPGV
jgi:hypothetical protein